MDSEENILSDLEARKRDHKVYITDEAIAKVPFIRYKEIPEEHYLNIYELAKKVLRYSKEKNNSNEVAIVYSLNIAQLIAHNQEYLGVAFGTEHEVNPEDSSISYHILKSTADCVVVCLHNHPNLSKFSLDDVKFFLRNSNVKMIVVVTNLGAISYLVKSKNYNRAMAVDVYNEAVSIHNLSRDLRTHQRAANYFLKECYRANVLYEDK